jgi:hypothetical protein
MTGYDDQVLLTNEGTMINSAAFACRWFAARHNGNPPSSGLATVNPCMVLAAQHGGRTLGCLYAGLYPQWIHVLCMQHSPRPHHVSHHRLLRHLRLLHTSCSGRVGCSGASGSPSSYEPNGEELQGSHDQHGGPPCVEARGMHEPAHHNRACATRQVLAARHYTGGGGGEALAQINRHAVTEQRVVAQCEEAEQEDEDARSVRRGMQ